MTPSRTSVRARFEAALGLAALVAAGLAMSRTPPPDPVLGGLVRSAVWLLRYPFEGLFALAALAGLVLIVGTVITALRAHAKGARVDGWGLLVQRLAITCCIYGLLTGMAMAMKALSRTSRPRAPVGAVMRPPRTDVPSNLPPPSTAPRSFRAPSASLGIAALLLAGGLAGLGWWLRRRPLSPVPEPARDASPLASARRRLEMGDAVRDAVIGCYAEMGEVFRPRMGIRADSLTAREFADALRREGATEPEIRTLTAVFEKARYSDEPCDERDRAQALEALLGIEHRYGQPEGRSGVPA